MSELFTIPECKSPRLAWLEAHGVWTSYHERISPADEDESSEYNYPWGAYVGVSQNGRLYRITHAGFGDTEGEAIVALAKKKGWRLWNEA